MSEPLAASLAIAKLTIKRGDVLVLQTGHQLTAAQADRLTSWAKERLPAGVHVLPLSSDVTIGVISRAPNQDARAKARKP